MRLEVDDVTYQVTEENPRVDERVVALPGGFSHDVGVGRVEAESGRGRAVGDEVHPQKLHGNHALGYSQRGRQEYRYHFSDVRGYHVSDERLHVAVNRPPLRHSWHDGAEIIVRQNHVRSLFRNLKYLRPPLLDVQNRKPFKTNLLVK